MVAYQGLHLLNRPKTDVQQNEDLRVTELQRHLNAHHLRQVCYIKFSVLHWNPGTLIHSVQDVGQYS